MKKSNPENKAKHKENDCFSFEEAMETSGVKPISSSPKPPQKRNDTSFEVDRTENVFFDYSDLDPSKKFKGYKPETKHRQKVKVNKQFKPDVTIDLHGETKESALDKVQFLITRANFQQLQSALIITGRGLNSSKIGGVLPAAVWSFLKSELKSNQVKNFQWAPPFLGGKGAILVFF